jgi:hypothetical protein
MAWIAEQVLTAIRDERVCDCITEERLVMVTGLTVQQVQRSTRVLRHNHLLEKTGAGCHKLTTAGLEALKAGARHRSGPKGGKQSGKRVWKDTVRICIWRAIRLRRKFTVPEIISLVADESSGDMTSNVQKYVRALAKAGYLIELPKREAGSSLTSNGYKRWWLTDDKDTGPEAPIWRLERSTVYDQTHVQRWRYDLANHPARQGGVVEQSGRGGRTRRIAHHDLSGAGRQVSGQDRQDRRQGDGHVCPRYLPAYRHRDHPRSMSHHIHCCNTNQQPTGHAAMARLSKLPTQGRKT